MTNHDYLGMSDSRSQLRGSILILMLKGAGYAAVFSLSVIFFVLIFYWIGLLLPEDARQQPDPLLRSGVEAPATGTTIHHI